MKPITLNNKGKTVGLSEFLRTGLAFGWRVARVPKRFNRTYFNRLGPYKQAEYERRIEQSHEKPPRMVQLLLRDGGYFELPMKAEKLLGGLKQFPEYWGLVESEYRPELADTRNVSDLLAETDHVVAERDPYHEAFLETGMALETLKELRIYQDGDPSVGLSCVSFCLKGQKLAKALPGGKLPESKEAFTDCLFQLAETAGSDYELGDQEITVCAVIGKTKYKFTVN